MGKKDSATKVLLRKPENFADAFNQFLYHGKQVIHPEDLQERDPEEIVLPFGTARGKTVDVTKLRDILKLCTVKTDGKLNYCILGIESQADVHYAMPVRNALYDMMNLSSQVSKRAKETRADKQITSGEFLSGFTKEDRLLPVITLVFYFGEAPWDGPRTLREMYEGVDEIVLSHAIDYKLNLISPREMNEEELDQFHSELRQVVTFLKYTEDTEMIKQNIMKQELFQYASEDVIRVVELFTSYRFPREEKEDVNMCKGLEGLRAEGVAEGLERGKQESRLTTLRNMLKREFSDELVMDVLECSAEELEELKKQL
ncbi:MAG: Rpn family recombination-promoting nuclease/putative transposase [Lachnospiraceae bacterium]|nr:Rpn family recombination-promoting nuclease/putative transposase [Lachnospiraceae bacterium]